MLVGWCFWLFVGWCLCVGAVLGRKGRCTVVLFNRCIRAFSVYWWVIVVAGVDSLGGAGSALWEAIHASRDVTSSHSPLVLNACRIADNLERIADELAKSGLISMNARGDEVANPLLVEHRMQLATLRQVLGALGVEKMDEQDDDGPSFEDRLAEQRLKREARGAV